jgi:hypothetical protein
MTQYLSVKKLLMKTGSAMTLDEAAMESGQNKRDVKN